MRVRGFFQNNKKSCQPHTFDQWCSFHMFVCLYVCFICFIGCIMSDFMATWHLSSCTLFCILWTLFYCEGEKKVFRELCKCCWSLMSLKPGGSVRLLSSSNVMPHHFIHSFLFFTYYTSLRFINCLSCLIPDSFTEGACFHSTTFVTLIW